MGTNGSAVARHGPILCQNGDLRPMTPFLTLRGLFGAAFGAKVAAIPKNHKKIRWLQLRSHLVVITSPRW